MKFEVKETYYLNNKPFQLISGAIHYFRVVPEYWRDRLEKLKNAGCNTVETYIPWNFHEPRKGELLWDGMRDVKKFIEIAQEIGLYVIVRPSPYICAEWEFGGLPAWLLKDRNMRVREDNPAFLNHVDAYYEELFKILTPLQINYGGPIIMFQIENEYGYYGNDKDYLLKLGEMMRNYGAVVPFVTSDGPWGEAFESGRVEGVHATGNFGSKAKENFPFMKKQIPGQPLTCMEYWIGWFDAWGEEHHVRSAEDCQMEMEDILSEGHVNVYMFHGGTNFGFMNGANEYEKFMPHTTSYDYDAAIAENGDLTAKYYGLKAAIVKHVEIEEMPLSTDIQKKAYPAATLVDKVSLFNTLDTISTPVHAKHTLTMEDLDTPYGYVLYRANLGRGREVESLRVHKCRDRANYYVNEKHVMTQNAHELGTPFAVTLDQPENNTVDILVENMGRVNFGEHLNDQRRGIQSAIIVDKHAHCNIEHYPLSLENIEDVDFSRGYIEGTPAFYRYEFEVDECGDTYIDMTLFGKGCVFLNGFNLGRFYEIGPQYHLYIPAPLLQQGRNELIVFETEGKYSETIPFKE